MTVYGKLLAGAQSATSTFAKSNPTIVAWTKTGAFTLATAVDLAIEVNGAAVTLATGTVITMPGSPAAGTDYAIWAKPDGTLEATASHTTPPITGARKVGGCHYAPGGNAAAQAGGDTTPAINAYSLWDLKFRPACPDPRGMALVAGGFWADIYLLGVDHHVNGTSKYNVAIADGASPPKNPLAFGGDGSATQANGDWWNLTEVLRSHGKRPPTYNEFAALAYGVTEATSIGSDPGSTILDAPRTSKWGVMGATGNMWVWGADFGGGAAAAAWVANTGGRGSTYRQENVAVFGGSWGSSSNSGSRATNWDYSPSSSGGNIGVRGVGDHLILD